jgi:glutathione-specific gamma-glutamylcyclotransferase
MPGAPRQMRLTAEHVRRAHRDVADPGPQQVPGFRHATDDDFADMVRDMLRTRPEGPFWLFAYGSLIWKPETAFTESKQAVARGWHRRFCLGWDHRWRGSPETPGLMMALDRGGQCRGMLYRLPEEGLEAELHKLIRRELSLMPSAFPWRWLDVATSDGSLRALTFAMDRRSARYIANLSEEQLADVLATACGFRGSMAEYLFSTVAKLEELGIHDRNLWRLQALVADRIDAAHPGEH